MREIPQILSTYQDVDSKLDAERTDALSQRSDLLDLKQILNDQAYFLLCWGQLELAVDERCRTAIRRRRDDPDWGVRRGWDLYNPDDRRLSGLAFEDRARLVLDQNGGRGGPFARTMFHYAVRNGIAHGRMQATRVDVTAFVQDCYVIQAALHQAD